MITKVDLIKCIYAGYDEGVEDLKNEDNPDYEGTFIELPIDGDEAQYAYELGLMLAREEMKIVKSELDDHIRDILFNSNSDLTFEQL
jgi:hypothetical protein